MSPTNHCMCCDHVLAGCSFEGGGTSEQNKSACHCNNGSRIASIINGCLCYSGITPGSKAYYTCDDGYEQAIECLQDGKWNGTPPLCRNSSTKVHASEGVYARLLDAAIYRQFQYPGTIILFFSQIRGWRHCRSDNRNCGNNWLGITIGCGFGSYTS